MRSTGILALALILSPALGSRAPAEDGARAVIDRAIAAAGGEDRLGRFKAAEWTCKGTAHASTELAFTDHCFAQWPEQFRNESAVEAADRSSSGRSSSTAAAAGSRPTGPPSP